jgi:amino acid adenylation domain-containing protein
MELKREEFIHSYWDIVRQTVEQYEDKKLVVTTRESVTYREAHRRSNVICFELQKIAKDKKGVGVGLFLKDHCAIVPAMMGVLKSQNYIVPLDVNYPKSTLIYIFQNVGIEIILTVSRYFDQVRSLAGDKITVLNLDEIDLEQEAADPDIKCSPEDMIQILFTSGSTGRPKGAIEDYRYLLDMVYGLVAGKIYKPEERFIQFATFTYTAPHVLYFTGLAMGFTICHYDVQEDGLADLPKWIHQQEITNLQCTPTLFRNLVNVFSPDETFPSVDLISLGAEKRLSKDIQDIKKHFPNVTRIRMGYSATETQSVCSATFPVDYDFGQKELPSGMPRASIKVYIWDEYGKELPAGEEGEIVVYGDAMARGYINNPELTRERFIPDPERPGWQYVKTGDLGKFRPDGQLVHLGRIDNMVKIRGIRVELDSIERLMLSFPGVVQVASRVFEDERGNKRLATYFVTEKGVRAPVSELRKHLAEQLPVHQLPHYLIELDELPLTTGGKVALNQLLPPNMVRPPLSNGYVTPADELEEKLVAIWEERIGVNGIGVMDDFFELGGDSLIGALLFAQVEEVLGKNLPVSTLLKATTIRDQARLIRGEDIELSFAPIIPINTKGDREPMFFIPGKGGYPTRVRHLARKIDPGTPIYALQDLVIDHPNQALRSVESIATFYLSEIRKRFPQGPRILVGESFGGLIAYEMAQQILKTGEAAPLLIMLDSLNQKADAINPFEQDDWSPMYRVWFEKHHTILTESDWQGRWEYVQFYWHNGAQKVKWLMRRRLPRLLKRNAPALPDRLRRNEKNNVRTGMKYSAQPYPGRVILFKATRGPASADPTNGWNRVALGELVIHPVDCYHGSILFEPAVSQVAAILQDYLGNVHA